jgi:hypothetical protein
MKAPLWTFTASKTVYRAFPEQLYLQPDTIGDVVETIGSELLYNSP